MYLAAAAIIFGLVTRQRWFFWGFAILAIGVHFAVGATMGPASPLFLSVKQLAEARNNAAPGLHVVFVAVVLGWGVPLLLLWIGTRRRK